MFSPPLPCNFPSLIIQDSALFAPIVTVFTPDLSELGLATFTGMMIRSIVLTPIYSARMGICFTFAGACPAALFLNS